MSRSTLPQQTDVPDGRVPVLVALLLVLVAIVLFKLDVPLGRPGQFTYPYSPIATQRITALPDALVLAALLAAGIGLVCAARRWLRLAGFLLAVVAGVALAGWVYFAPPQFRSQQFFNMQSPSHDGAFLTEAFHARRVGLQEYLQGFPERARTPPDEMRGTRVISNPPATTLLAAGTIGLLEASPRLAGWLRAVGVNEQLPPREEWLVTASAGFSLLLLLLWLLAGLPLYAAGRLFLSPPAAAAIAVVCLFSPPTLLFAPGKDPAQLLTVALPLWLWLLAWRRHRPWAAALAGVLFTLACLVSLVHVWIGVIVFVATALRTPAGRRRRFVLGICTPALAGALAVVGGLALLAGTNFLACAWAAARAQAEITRGADAMPLVWQALGLPLFLLFVGPALWSVGLWLLRRRLRDGDARFGLCLIAGAAGIMLATIGFTNVETPRLWIPFAPLLLLGAALQLPLFRRPGERAAVLLAALVFVQIGVAAVQWSLMDMREAETRLLERGPSGPRMFE